MKTICAKCNREIRMTEPGFIVEGEIWCRDCHEPETKPCPTCGAAIPVIGGIYQGCRPCSEKARRERNAKWNVPELADDERRAIKHLADLLPSFEIRPDYFVREREHQRRAHRQASTEDICWGVLNSLSGKVKEMHALRELTLAKMHFLRECGRDSSHVARAFIQLRLRELERLGIEQVELCTGCCDVCDQNDGKRISLKSAMNCALVSNPNCQRFHNEGDRFLSCICSVEGVFDGMDDD